MSGGVLAASAAMIFVLVSNSPSCHSTWTSGCASLNDFAASSPGSLVGYHQTTLPFGFAAAAGAAVAGTVAAAAAGAVVAAGAAGFAGSAVGAAGAAQAASSAPIHGSAASRAVVAM